MKTISILLSLSLCVLPSASIAANIKSPVRNPGSLVHLTTRSWFTFDPAAAFDAVSFIVTGNVYESLITYRDMKDPDALIPFLASEVPSRENKLVSENGLVYRFPVRQGVKFHSGESLTPEDIRYSLLRFMLHDIEGGPSALLLRPILGVYTTRDGKGNPIIDFEAAAKAVVVDGDAVVVTLKKPDATFLKALAALPIVVSKKWSVKNGEWDGSEKTWMRYNNRPLGESFYHANANGTGPFKVKRADRAKGDLLLARHNEYWRKPAALEDIMMRVVPSKALRLWMLENGDADTSYFEDRDYMEAKELMDVQVAEQGVYASLGEVLFFGFRVDSRSTRIGSGKFDGKGVPTDFFSDINIRKGFAHALDYKGYFRRGLGMRGKRAAGAIPDFLMEGQKPSRMKMSIRKARKYFKKAFDGKAWENGFTVTLAYSPSNASRIVLARLLKANLEKINPKFKLEIRPLKSSELYDEAERHRLPLFIAGYYADYPDAHSFAFGMLHSSGYYPKAQRYSNSEIDALVETAAATPDREKRYAVYREIVKKAEADLPQVYTYQPARFSAGRLWVQGLGNDENVNNLRLNNFPYFYALSKQ